MTHGGADVRAPSGLAPDARVPPPGDDRPTVLVLRALGLGDGLTGVAALRGIRRAWPGHRLVLACPAPLGTWLRDLGLVDEVLPSAGLAPLRWPWPDRPGVAVNLHGRGPQSHALLHATDPDDLVAFAASDAGVARGPAWDEDEHEVLRWCRLVRSAGGECGPEDLRLPRPPNGLESGASERYLVLHAGASSPARRWPVDRWARVTSVLVDRGWRVVLTGSVDERSRCTAIAVAAAVGNSAAVDGAGVVNLAGAQDLPALAATVAGAELVISGDTGVGHLATAYGVPSVLLFGPVPPRWWRPLIDADRHAVLWHGADGAGAALQGDSIDPALGLIQPDEVLDAAQALLRPVPAA